MMFRVLILIFALIMGAMAHAQPLRIEITDGVIEPMPFAAPRFMKGYPLSSEIVLPPTLLMKKVARRF